MERARLNGLEAGRRGGGCLVFSDSDFVGIGSLEFKFECSNGLSSIELETIDLDKEKTDTSETITYTLCEKYILFEIALFTSAIGLQLNSLNIPLQLQPQHRIPQLILSHLRLVSKIWEKGVQ